MIQCPRCRTGESTKDNVDGVFHTCICGYKFISVPKTNLELIKKDETEIYYLERRNGGKESGLQ